MTSGPRSAGGSSCAMVVYIAGQLGNAGEAGYHAMFAGGVGVAGLLSHA